MTLVWVHGRSRHEALGSGLGVLLVGLIVLGVAPGVRAQQMPPGCSGTCLTLSIFAENAAGTLIPAGSAVSLGDTLHYGGSLTNGSTGCCCFQGGTVAITTPRTCASDADCTDNPTGACGPGGQCSYDVTPAGGVPEKCPGDPVIDTLTVQYQVRSQDVVNGFIIARIDFTAAQSFTGTPPSLGVPSGSASIPNTVGPSPTTTTTTAAPLTTTTGATTTTTTQAQMIQCCVQSSPMGAFDTCVLLTATQCSAQSGLNAGLGSCSPNPCPPSTTTTTVSAGTTTTVTTTATSTTRPRPTTTTLLSCGGVFPRCGGSCPGGMRCTPFGRTKSCVCR